MLDIGTRLGPYEILAPVGAGGMGEVYRARDSRLDRVVAVKVIRYGSADNPQLIERFEREARAAATLTHPHACTVHDIGREGGINYLVMEYVEGETLADRLARGPLPLDQALTFSVQVAGALDAAHRRGIVHRDVKPGNIMLTGTGAKLLDFGLARLRDVIVHKQALASTAVLGGKPLTAEGMILGTLEYMAPEQIEGREADARADIFAFGAVLYEAMTGRRAFSGSSPASVITAILSTDPPPVSASQPLATPAIDHLLQRCLAREPDDRWQTARDVFHELVWLQRASDPSAGGTMSGAGRTWPRRWLRVAPWAISAVAVIAAAYLWFRPAPAPGRAPLGRFTITLPAGERLALARNTPVGLGRVAMSLSPDESTLVYAGRRLYVRRLDSFESRALPKSEGAYAPVFSPDGRWVAFVSGNSLKKVALSGGDPVTLCDTRNVMAIRWGARGIVLLDQFMGRLALVDPDGGTDPRVLGTGGNSLGLLPRDDVVLVSGGLMNNPDRSVIEAVSLTTGERKTLPTRGVQPGYLADRYLTVGRGGTLFAVPFDLTRLEVVGPEVPVEHNIRMEVPATAQYAVSPGGTLAYVSGSVGWISRFVWRSLAGVETPLDLPAQAHGTFRISPDGRQIAFVEGGATGDAVWIHDLQRRTSRRLTRDGDNSYVVWTPDGLRLVFARQSAATSSVWWASVEGDAPPERLTADRAEPQRPYSVSSDGKQLAYMRGGDIWFLELFAAHGTRPFLETPQQESMPMFSPDGRWIAHTSDESGRTELYVRPAAGGAAVQVSTDSGEEAVWAASSRQLFYRNGSRWMTTTLHTDSGFAAAPPTLVFQGPYLNVPAHSYAVGRDGRFLLLRGVEAEEDVTSIQIVLNWDEEVRRLVSTRRGP